MQAYIESLEGQLKESNEAKMHLEAKVATQRNQGGTASMMTKFDRAALNNYVSGNSQN